MRRSACGHPTFDFRFLLAFAPFLIALVGGCGAEASASGDEESEDESEDSEDEEEEEEEDETPPPPPGKNDDDEDEDEDAASSMKKDAGPKKTVASRDAAPKPGPDGGVAPAAPGVPGFGAPPAPVARLDPSIKTPDPSKLPQINGECPTFKNGRFTVAGTTGTFWVGSKPGPLLFYWHGTGSSASEVETGIGGATSDVQRNGGIVASFENTNGRGDLTGNAVWYTGDFEAADQILACGIEAGLVDPARVHSSGYSAGGLQTGAMVFARSNYLASAIVYSGGPALGGLVPGSMVFVDPSHIPSVIGAHGAQGSDWLALDFSDGTKKLDNAVAAAGGFAVGCDDGGSHLDFFTIRADVGGQAWQFLKDHPYNTQPSPYASGLPSGFPRYCEIVK